MVQRKESKKVENLHRNQHSHHPLIFFRSLFFFCERKIPFTQFVTIFTIYSRLWLLLGGKHFFSLYIFAFVSEPPSLGNCLKFLAFFYFCFFFYNNYSTCQFRWPDSAPEKLEAEATLGTAKWGKIEETNEKIQRQIYVGNLSIMDLSSRYGDLEVISSVFPLSIRAISLLLPEGFSNFEFGLCSSRSGREG